MPKGCWRTLAFGLIVVSVEGVLLGLAVLFAQNHNDVATKNMMAAGSFFIGFWLTIATIYSFRRQRMMWQRRSATRWRQAADIVWLFPQIFLALLSVFNGITGFVHHWDWLMDSLPSWSIAMFILLGLALLALVPLEVVADLKDTSKQASV